MSEPLHIENAREQAVRARIEKAGLLTPEAVILSRNHHTVAVAFRIGTVIETFEGRGASADAMAEDITRQLRRRLDRRLN
jgi:hypothetical protein